MSNHKTLDKILEHPDKDEIISKLIIDVAEYDISSWLKTKYDGDDSGKKFILSESSLKDFKSNYLDIYSKIKDDILKVKNLSSGEKLELALQNNNAYKNIVMKTAETKLDIEEKIIRLVNAIEERAAEVFNEMQGRGIDFKRDEVLIKYFDLLGSQLERYYNMRDREESKKLQADVVNNNTTNVTIVLDQQVNNFYQIFKEILETLDFQTSMRCMEMFTEKLSKLKQLNTKELTLNQEIAEVASIDAKIQKRLNE